MTTDGPAERLVDWSRTARRVRTSAVGAAAIAFVGWAFSAAFGGPGPGTWIGVAVGLVFLAEVVVVGGSALRGMLRAGERGDRLAGGDVGLLPTRRRHRRAP